MKNKILISILSAIVLGLIIIPSALTVTYELLPFKIGAAFAGGIAVFFLLGFLDSLFSDQRKAYDLINKNSERQILELEALRVALEMFQKDNSEILTSLSSQQLSTLDQISKNLINTLKGIETQFTSNIENLSVKTNDVKDEISTAIVGAVEKMNHQFIKQNEIEANLLREILNKQDKESENIQKAFSISVVKLSEILIEKSGLIENALISISEIQTSSKDSINGLKESIDDRFDNLVGMNVEYEKSLATINHSIEHFFRDNETLQKDIHMTVEEIKILQENMQKTKEEQDKVIEEILHSAILEIKDTSASTLSTLDKCNNDLSTEIHSLIQQMKSDAELYLLGISETMQDQRKLTDDVLQATLNDIRRISRDSNNRLEESSKELNDTLKEMFEDQSDDIADVTKELENIGNKIDDNITLINATISDMTTEMARISSTIPQIKELSKSEEQLMKELERICTSRR